MSRMWPSILLLAFVEIAEWSCYAQPPHTAVFTTNHYISHNKCGFFDACDVRDSLMVEINALKEKLVEIVNFQVEVNQFRFEHGVHRTEMEEFRKEVVKFMESLRPSPVPLDTPDTPSNDAPVTVGGDSGLASLNKRINELEHKMNVWSDNGHQRDELIQQRELLEDKVGDLQKKVDTLQNQLTESETKRIEMNRELWELRETTKKHDRAIGRLQDEELSSRVKDLEETLSYVKEIELKLTFKDEEIQDTFSEDFESLRRNTSSKMRGLDKAVRQIHYDLRNLTERTDDLEYRVTGLADDFSQLDDYVWKQNNETERMFLSMRRTTDSLRRLMETESNSFNSTFFNESWQQTQDEKLNDLQFTLAQAEMSLSDLNHTFAVKAAQIDAKYDHLFERLKQDEAWHQALQNEVKSYETHVGICAKDLDAVKQRSASDAATLKSMKYDMKQLQHSMDNLDKDRLELKSNVSEMFQTVKWYVDNNFTSTNAALPLTLPSGKITRSNVSEATKPQEDSSPSSTCQFISPSDPNVVTSFKKRPLTGIRAVLSNGDEIFHRCTDIGLYKMHGDRKRQCVDGIIKGQDPKCEKLFSVDDITGNDDLGNSTGRTPSIVIDPKPNNLTTGVTPDGKLIVVPGSKLTLACVFRRNFGAVKWTFSSAEETYDVNNTNWSHEWRNEVKMSSARSDQSGVYSCKHGPGSQHNISVIVTEIHCPQPPQDPEIHVDTVNTRMHSTLQFSCTEPGRELRFPDTNKTQIDFRCLPSGEWSHDFPTCVDPLKTGG